MRQIKYIIVHCSASNQAWNATDLLVEFRRKGWKNPGYHYAIETDGTIQPLLDEHRISNGVKGHNRNSINVAYIGGIDDKGNPIDNRTNEQKESLIKLLKELKQRYPKATICGHRDFSKDLNGNGIIDPWERMKACPCFDAKEEYKDI